MVIPFPKSYCSDTSNEEEEMKKYHWNGMDSLSNGIYYDVTSKPLFEGYYDTYSFRKTILDSLPVNRDCQSLQPLATKFFSPFTFNGDMAFCVGFKEAYYNHPFEPFTLMLLTIRSYWSQFYDFVDGYCVLNEDDYLEVRQKYNKLWGKILGGMNGIERKYAEVEDVIHISALFYILKMCGDYSEGMLLDEEWKVYNPWSGKPKVMILDDTLIQYSFKLRNSYFSGLNWTNFFFRYAEQSDEDSLWGYIIPKFNDDATHFNTNNLAHILNQQIPHLSRKGSRTFLVMDSTPEFINKVVDYIGLKKHGDSLRKKGFIASVEELPKIGEKSPTIHRMFLANYHNNYNYSMV